MSEKKLIMIHARPWHSLVGSLGSGVVSVAIIGTGVWLESAAMEWFGFVSMVVTMLAMACRSLDNNEKTPQEAADWLKAEYGVTANDR